MSHPVQGIQPVVLKWARETAGMSVTDVAERLRRKPSDISDWEAGTSAPSYPQLERLAYKIYRRPLAIFFFPEPPDEDNPKAEFRSLPSSELEELSPDTLHHVRHAKAYQVALGELHDGKNPVLKPIFKELRISRNSPTSRAAQSIRTFLGVTLEDQWQSSDDDEALKAWRAAFENAGVHVFKSSIKQKRVSGFSLHHSEFPLVYLNNSTSKTRQIFTLLHELAHLLLGHNGMTTLSQVAFGGYTEAQRRIEVFCNSVAAEVLVPDAELTTDISRAGSLDDEWIARIAQKYRVSREVILRRLLDRDLITRDEYQGKAAIWNEAREKKTSNSGGTYYNNIGTYLSEQYMQAVFANHYRGRLDIDQVADYLGVKTRAVAELESRVQSGIGQP